MDHQTNMRRCFQLAKKALGHTSPNPYVGAVIVQGGLIIADGYHKKAGEDHAEIAAIKAAKQSVEGATLYCNLEPCCHTNKRTPPCVDQIIEAKIETVVISNLDPNPEVAGKGVAKLEDAGIQVIIGILEEEGALLNEVFFTHITKRRPFIHLKWAQTLDGKIATKSFNSKWITGEKARRRVHQERMLYDAIAVGSRTVTHDDPALTIRLPNEDEVCKKRLIFTHSGELSPHLKVFEDKYQDQTTIITGSPISFEARHILCPKKDEGIDLQFAMDKLYALGVSSIYIEGGARLLNSFISADLYDRISVYVAPKLLGEGISTMSHISPGSIEEALYYKDGMWTILDHDVVFETQRNICLQD